MFELKARIMIWLPTFFGVLFELTLWYWGGFKKQEVIQTQKKNEWSSSLCPIPASTIRTFKPQQLPQSFCSGALCGCWLREYPHYSWAGRNHAILKTTSLVPASLLESRRRCGFLVVLFWNKFNGSLIFACKVLNSRQVKSLCNLNFHFESLPFLLLRLLWDTGDGIWGNPWFPDHGVIYSWVV